MSWDSTSKSTDIKYIHEDIFTKQNKNKVDRKQNTIRSNGSSREAKHKSVNGLQYRQVRGWGGGWGGRSRTKTMIPQHGFCVDTITDVQHLDSVYTERQYPHYLCSVDWYQRVVSPHLKETIHITKRYTFHHVPLVVV